MNFKSIHLENCSSTQTHLENHIKAQNNLFENIIISTSNQTKGMGRHNRNWDFFNKSLAFSFTVLPHKTITLTALEIAVLINNFFSAYYKTNLKLKWPNDIINQSNQKCGGIIAQLMTNSVLVIGVGLNLASHPNDNPSEKYKVEAGYINLSLKDNNFQEQIPQKIYDYILSNRLDTIPIIEQWNQMCIHINQTVKIVDQQGEFQGQFKGISDKGSALIYDPNSNLTKEFFSGTLLYVGS